MLGEEPFLLRVWPQQRAHWTTLGLNLDVSGETQTTDRLHCGACSIRDKCCSNAFRS
jgi:hypothetical protein